MTEVRKIIAILIAGVLTTPAVVAEERDADAEILHFSLQEGRITNEFYRQGPVAAHTLLTSGETPRLIVAFPAGNSGVSLWFRPQAAGVTWEAVDGMTAERAVTPDGHPLYGITAEVTVRAAELTLEKALLGSIRTIRNYRQGVAPPDIVESDVTRTGTTVTWSRPRLDGGGGYRLALTVLEGEIVEGKARKLTFRAGADNRLRLRLTALTGDVPLTPLESGDLLNDRAATDDPLSRQILAFLSYREKMLAGSWRFLTYFGRDTLLSLRLLMPVLKPEAVEAGLGSVIARLNRRGEVAHEEDIGEYALLRRRAETGETSAAPLYDYTMRDDNYILPAVVAHYLLERPGGRDRAAAFLARRTAAGQSYGDLLMRNVTYVTEHAKPFAEDPVASHLIGLKEDSAVGEWRDSQEGLGGGRYPYDVNAVFVPAALGAIADLTDSGLLDPYLAEDARRAEVRTYAKIWRERAPTFFEISLPSADAKQQISAYAASLGTPGAAALAAVGDRAVRYYALALDEGGQALPVLHSDIGFMMLFDRPSAVEIDHALESVMRPFPAGLLTPVGLVVANPVFAPQPMKAVFTTGNYHGTVVWSWQQALLAAGLVRQLQRDDLPAPLRDRLRAHQATLWQVIRKGRDIQTSELWSWRIRDGDYAIAPFGQSAAHRAESNAAQLWSTVYLALQPPVRRAE